MKTFEQVREELTAFRLADWSGYVELRQVASRHLEADLRDWLGDDHGHGISSSDVSCHLVEMIQHGELSIDSTAFAL